MRSQPALTKALGWTHKKTPCTATLHNLLKILDVDALEKTLTKWVNIVCKNRSDLTECLTSETSDTIDVNCFIGATKKLPIRLVALRLSEEQANSQRRAIRRKAKRKGTTPSKKRLQRAD